MVQTLWRREPGFPALARAGHATCVCDGKLLVFGGERGEVGAAVVAAGSLKHAATALARILSLAG
jgi:N-acetylneuraminic acid mutarotase